MPPMRMKEHARAKKGTLKRLIKEFVTRYPWQLVLVFFCIVINVFSNLCSSIFAKQISLTILNGTTLGWDFEVFSKEITKYLLMMGGIYLIGMVCSYLWTRTMAVITQKYMNELRKMIFDHMESLPIKYFDTHPHGDIMSIYTNDTDTIRQFVSQALPQTISSVAAILGCLVYMLLQSLWLTLVVVLGAIGMIMVTKVIGGKSSRYFVKQQRSLGKVEGNIEESMHGLKVIKVFSHEDKSQEEFDILNNELCKNMTIANVQGNIMGPIMMNIGNFIYVLSATLGCILIVAGGTNVSLTGVSVVDVTFIATIVSFLMMCRMFTNNVNQLAQNITFIIMGMAGASRIFDLIDEESETDNGYVTLVKAHYDENGNIVELNNDDPLVKESHGLNKKQYFYAWKHPHQEDGTITYTKHEGDILLQDVDFGYVSDKIVLHDINIYAHPGQKIAFVGATGAGKTTITNLINRFYDIADGKIRYDGININKIKKADLRRSLGIVLQDTNLFTGTVMDNIRYGRLDASDEEVYEAAKIANAYDFIMRLPEGFNTMLSGDGSNVSQGQRQLLSIARAAVADAPVMILDEATSSIDTRTEKLVQAGTDRLMEGRTVFVIAHRLSTIHNSDAIMVLDHGRIIERGNHDDLIKLHGVYYQLYTGAFELE